VNAFLESLTLWLVDFFVLTSVLLAASLALRLIVRGPAARVTLVWGTWFGILAMAVLTALPSWPRIDVEQIAAPGGWESNANETPPGGEPLSPVTPDPFDSVVEFEPTARANSLEPAVPVVATTPPIIIPSPAPTIPWTTVLPATWLVTVALGLGWVLLGHWRTLRLLATAKGVPAWVRDEFQTEELKQKPTKGALALAVSSLRSSRPAVQNKWFANGPGLWSSDRITSAVAIGARSPQIVLPESCVAEESRPAVRAALAHEWAHIRHGDLWLLALERTLLPLVAVHPLFWWLRRSVRLDQELLADAAAAGEEPVAYAEALLAWARSAQSTGNSTSRHGLAAVGMWENPSTLTRRVAMLVDPKRPLARPLGRGWAAMLAGSLAALVLGLSLVSLRPLTAQEDAARPAPPDTIIEVAPGEPKRRYREVPGPVPPATAGFSTTVTKIILDALVISVDRAKLDAADTTLEDAIAEATQSRCRKEAGLVVSEIKPEEVVKLLEGLQKHKAVKVLSQPKVLTLDGREATLHVGGEAPILRVEETINGKHEERIEYKEFGTILMLRPKLDANEKEEFVRLDIVAEQSSLIPPGEKAGALENEPGAVPRDVPGLVSHKFNLTADVKFGGSLLVAESPPNQKQLRDAVKQQFLLIVTPQRAVREAAAVYADPREGEKGEAARKATEADLEAATAAEPEPGTAAAALLKRERELRAKETAELRKQIEALTSDLQALRAATGHKVMTRVFPVQNRRSENIAADLQKLFAPTPAKDRIQISGDGKTITIQADESILLECEKLIVALDRSGPEIDPQDPNAEHVQKVWKLLAERRQQAVAPIGELKDDVQFFPPGPEHKSQYLVTRVYRLTKGNAREHKAKFDELLAKSPLAAHKIAVNFKGDVAEVYAPAELMGEVKKLLESLGAEEIAVAPPAERPVRTQPATTKRHSVVVYRLQTALASGGLEKLRQVLTDKGLQAVLSAPDGEAKTIRVESDDSRVHTVVREFLSNHGPLEVAEYVEQQPAPAARPPAATRGSLQENNQRLLELDLAQAKLEVDKAEKDLARIQRLDVSQAEVDVARFALAAAQIQAQKAAARLEGSASVPATAADPARSPVSKATEVKLLELDLAEAKLSLDAAELELARIQQLRERNVVPDEEVQKQRFATERAKIQVQRIMVKLEAANAGK
jgi:hypothetical protein